MTDEELPLGEDLSEKNLLFRIARELRTIRILASQVVNASVKAESEIPESIRRFVTYMHDVHDVCYMYESRGLQPPPWVHREMERCDDRYRQLVAELNAAGGAFEKIRREMAKDPENRWDHTKLLPKEGA